MLFWKKKTPPLVQSSASAWREQWRAIVPPECRNVPVTVGDKTVTAYVQINHFVMMLQDGLLMEEHFSTSAPTSSARATMSSGSCAARRTSKTAT